mgnify:CR=1 FL=1
MTPRQRNDLEISSRFYPKEVIKDWLIEMTPEIILEKSKQRICFVAEENGIIIGHISLYNNEIKKLHVLPEFHGKSIGKQLLQEIEKVAKSNRLTKLIVLSSVYAEPFYKKCGFKNIRDDWQKVGDINYKLIRMEKKIK